jgi:cell division septation protein DedD
LYNVYIEKFNSRPDADKEAKILKELALISNYDVREIFEKTRKDSIQDKQEIVEKARITSAAPDPDATQKTEKKSVVKPETPKKSESDNAGRQDAKGYYLKVSSLKEKANAEETVRILKDAGYQAFYNYENVKGMGDWYRVYIEGYQSKDEAEKDAKKLMGSRSISGYEIKRAAGIVRSSDTTQKEEN